MKRGLLIGVVIVAVIISAGAAAAYSYSQSGKIPSEGQLPDEIIAQEKETVALVLAMDKEMWLNQKQLWLHLEQYTHSKMWPDCIDKEIAGIEEFAKNYHLPLP